MLILTDRNGKEIRYIKDRYKIDVDLNETKDFVLEIPHDEYSADIKEGCRVFVPNTEYGGIIGNINIITKTSTLKRGGTTWRGFIRNKVIRPNAGQPYKVVSGELNEVVRNLFTDNGLNPIFQVSTASTEEFVNNYQFDRYTNLYDGIVKMLESKGYRLNLVYKQGEQGQIGCVLVEAVPIVDWSNYIELSQNQKLNFTFSTEVNKCNHLICLGAGALTQRQIIDLYIQEDGTIGDTKYYTGLNEVVEIYVRDEELAVVYKDTEEEEQIIDWEETNRQRAEQLANLRSEGIDKLKELTNQSIFGMDVSEITEEMPIGDVIGGRDYITGISMKKPIQNKIYKEENGISSIEYQLKGDDNTESTIIQ